MYNEFESLRLKANIILNVISLIDILGAGNRF